MKAALFCTLVVSVVLSACVPVRDVIYYRQRNPTKKPTEHFRGGEASPAPNPEEDDKLDTEIADFERVQLHILKDHCVQCHNPKKTKGDVDLSTLEVIMETEGLVVPGRPEESLLYQVLDKELSDKEMLPHMPPKKEPPLSEKQIQFVKRWIESL